MKAFRHVFVSVPVYVIVEVPREGGAATQHDGSDGQRGRS